MHATQIYEWKREPQAQVMGLVALTPQPPATSQAAPDHPTYPYLLRGLKVDRVNQVWAARLEGGRIVRFQEE